MLAAVGEFAARDDHLAELEVAQQHLGEDGEFAF